MKTEYKSRAITVSVQLLQNETGVLAKRWKNYYKTNKQKQQPVQY